MAKQPRKYITSVTFVVNGKEVTEEEAAEYIREKQQLKMKEENENGKKKRNTIYTPTER